MYIQFSSIVSLMSYVLFWTSIQNKFCFIHCIQLYFFKLSFSYDTDYFEKNKINEARMSCILDISCFFMIPVNFSLSTMFSLKEITSKALIRLRFCKSTYSWCYDFISGHISKVALDANFYHLELSECPSACPLCNVFISASQGN